MPSHKILKSLETNWQSASKRNKHKHLGHKKKLKMKFKDSTYIIDFLESHKWFLAIAEMLGRYHCDPKLIILYGNFRVPRPTVLWLFNNKVE